MMLHLEKKEKKLFDSIQKLLYIRYDFFFIFISDLYLVYIFVLLPLSQSLLKLRHVYNTYVGSLL